MKNTVYLLGVIFMLAVLSACQPDTKTDAKVEAEAETTAETTPTNEEAKPLSGTVYTLDLAASKVEWEGRGLAHGHKGTVAIKSGRVSLSDGEISGGEFVLDMSTIAETDNDDKEKVAKLVGHLKSGDFFDVEKYPEAKFEITGSKPFLSAAGTTEVMQTVLGRLTIKETTNNIAFPANIKTEGEGLTASANFSINRVDWGVKYNSGTVFSDIGDKLIKDEITFVIHLAAAK